METLLSVALGLGLAAACGFRVFVPLLAMSVAVRAGHMELISSFDWVASDVALGCFAVATVLEIGGYYIPWVDNLLDTVATPAAVVAGILVTGSVITDMSPFLRWTLAALAGGAVSTGVQAVTVAGRQISSFTTLGLGNPVIATLEALGAVAMAVLAIAVPLAGVVALAILLALAVRRVLFHQPRMVGPTGEGAGGAPEGAPPG
jgi:hypothetical protein